MSLTSFIQRTARRLCRWSWYLSGRLREVSTNVVSASAGADWVPVPKSFPLDLPEDTAAAEQAVADILAHRFDLLGSGPVVCSRAAGGNSVYEPIDWACDFTSAYVWPPCMKPWRALQTEKLPYGVDVKWPWELSRFQHLPHLAVCAAIFAKSKTDKSAGCLREIVHQISDWIAANPTGVGVNWACEMDVAVRAVNWVLAVRLSGVDGSAARAWQKMYGAALRQHGRYLYSFLRIPVGKCGNHYVAELAGLYIIGLLAPPECRDVRWTELARSGLEEQMRLQICDDGTHHEQSVTYHLLMTEMFLFALLLGRAVRDDFSPEFVNRLKKMLDVLGRLASSGLHIPRIGDDDGGLFIKAWGVTSPDRRLAHVFDLARQLDSDVVPDLASQMAQIAVFRGNAREPAPLMAPGIRVYERAGWAVMRQPEMELTLTAGSGGTSGCGHGHDDDLSFCLFWSSRPVVVDAGTGCYTAKPDVRNLFRSRRMHNAPILLEDGNTTMTDQLPFQPFQRPSAAIRGSRSPARIQAEAAYKSYYVSRGVEWGEDDKTLIIRDLVRGQGTIRLAVCLAPDVVCRIMDENIIRLETGVVTLFIATEDFEFNVEPGPYSGEYGRVGETCWLVCEKPSDDREMVWRISQRKQ